MSNLQTARSALVTHINFLKAEQARLNSVLVQLGSPGDESTGKKRGRKSAADKAATSETELAAAVDMVRGAGKGGIKAIKLAHELRRAGHGKVSKIDLLGTQKIKMTGKGGGSTYVYHG